MSEHSAIEWTHATFNAWRGCQRVSEGCRFCYAETLAHRNPAVLGRWGPGGTRVVASESYWRQPLAWDRNAAAAGERRRVFCASLADVFEDWSGPMVGASGGALLDHHGDWWEVVPGTSAKGLGRPITMHDVRVRLFNLVQRTPHLDWLILTKRPKNVRPMLNAIRDEVEGATWSLLGCMEQYGHIHFRNIWIGASVEDQETADARIPHLLKIPAAVRFLSVEPLLGPIDLGRFLCCPWCAGAEPLRDNRGTTYHVVDGTPMRCPTRSRGSAVHNIDWLIVGGESGPGARPMHPDWARKVRDDCVAAGVPFFFKQWGGTNKKVAGRVLDGRTWEEFPCATKSSFPGGSQ